MPDTVTRDQLMAALDDLGWLEQTPSSVPEGARIIQLDISVKGTDLSVTLDAIQHADGSLELRPKDE